MVKNFPPSDKNLFWSVGVRNYDLKNVIQLSGINLNTNNH